MNQDHTEHYRISIEPSTRHEKASLLQQLEKIPKDAKALTIEDNTPSDLQWAILGSHFTSVRDLKLIAGFHECLNDEKIPLHWPLEKLFIADSCGETFRSPWVLEGRVKHLVIFLAAFLRFEGPTTQEYIDADEKAIEQGEREQETFTVQEGTDSEHKVAISYVPDMVNDWMKNKYTKPANAKFTVDPAESHTELPSMNIQTLEIIENDAFETMIRFLLAAKRDVGNLTTLTVRSTNTNDFNYFAPQMVQEILPQLKQLKTLVLTVGENAFGDWTTNELNGDNTCNNQKAVDAAAITGKDFEQSGLDGVSGSTATRRKYEGPILSTLYRHLPPNLQALHFRGPASLTTSCAWPEWLNAFSSKNFLPDLQTLSFVLDLDVKSGKKRLESNAEKSQEEKAEVEGAETEAEKVETEKLRSAKRECERLLEGVKLRGVKVQPFIDDWSSECSHVRGVDERWETL
ncbi:MAG: hypothetical protein Q9227_009228 [Pyrenula ochraceoflavens]